MSLVWLSIVALEETGHGPPNFWKIPLPLIVFNKKRKRKKILDIKLSIALDFYFISTCIEMKNASSLFPLLLLKQI